MTTLYNLSSKYWDGDSISVRSLTSTGDIFATIPIGFIVRGGVNTWQFVLDILEMLVASASGHPRSIRHLGGRVIDMTLPPVAGQYVYIFQRESYLLQQFTLPLFFISLARIIPRI